MDWSCGDHSVLYYLAGLTCNEDTACVLSLSAISALAHSLTPRSRFYRPWKGGFIRDAAAEGEQKNERKLEPP